LFSVVPVEHQQGTFLLSVEEDFAQALNDTELRAAVAHELGHVWIYTHFPFLQTEQLANDIASRVISRDTLTPLYDKVWKKAAAD
jgi:predicted Zn-dependent protease